VDFVIRFVRYQKVLEVLSNVSICDPFCRWQQDRTLYTFCDLPRLEQGTPIAVVARVLGWSAGTAVRMTKRYGHIRAEVQSKLSCLSQPLKFRPP
jgi:hypothetical protein